MPKKCIVKNCVSFKNESLHRIPKDIDQRNIWLDLLDLPDDATGRICSKHFDPSDFEVKLDGHIWLKRCSYPRQVEYEFVDEFFNEIEIDETMRDAIENVSTALNIIYKEHNYCKFPKKIKTAKKFEVNFNNRCLVMSLRRTVKRLRQQINTLKLNHKKENRQFENFPNMSELLQELVLLLMKHHKPNSAPRKYSALIRKFALTLHYHSPEAYRFVRFTLNKCIPHPQTIAAWYRVIDGKPGFTNESLDALTQLQQRTPYKIVVSIVLDGMAIRKHLRRMGDKTVGYTDCGGVLPEVDEKNQVAKESLIFLAVGVNVPFKIQFGYFLINSLTGKQLAYLTEIGISLIIKCNLIVGSLTHDGLKAQFLMDVLLGCSFTDVKHLVTSFEVDGQKIYVFPDMSHMIKLARNFVCDEISFVDGYGRTISWKYFVNLQKLQESLGFHLGNKLRKLHINYKNQIMKVYLATQLFSASTADAIEFCDEVLQLPDFKYSAATVEFIRVMNDVFDIFNSRRMTDSFYKQPIHKNNYTFIMDRLDYIRKYLLLLTDMKGTPVYKGPRYTFVVGMLVLIESLKCYFKDFVENQKLLTFVPTYKQSQDSVEIFNCCMRSFGGYNTNPTAVTFVNAYKKSLLQVQFHEKFTGNCTPLENIPILHCNSSSRPTHTAQYIADEEFEQYFENAVIFKSFRVNIQAYYSVIAHIAGYIGRRLCAVLKCTECSTALIYKMSDEELSHPEDNEDLGYDDVTDDYDMDMHGDEGLCYKYNDDMDYDIENNEQMDYNIAFDDTAGNDGIVFNDDSHYEDEETDSLIDDFELDHEGDEEINDDNDIDLSQAEEISKKYFDLIKKKDRGGLFYPSDSLYRIAILADIVFTTALKQSGGKMLNKRFSLNKLVVQVHHLHCKYSEVIFAELKEHFQLEQTHIHALIENVARFYLKIRIDFLNKTVSTNSGRRQKVTHELHFQGM